MFSAGGVATPADAALMMRLGAEGVFVGSGIFKSEDPERTAAAVVEATTHFEDPARIAAASRDLGAPMTGIGMDAIDEHGGTLRPARLVSRSAYSPSRATSRHTPASWRRWAPTHRWSGRPRTSTDLDGLVIPGGESTTMTLGIEREGLAEPLRELVGGGCPTLGTCAGLIMLDRDHLGPARHQRPSATPSAARSRASRPTSTSRAWARGSTGCSSGRRG